MLNQSNAEATIWGEETLQFDMSHKSKEIHKQRY